MLSVVEICLQLGKCSTLLYLCQILIVKTINNLLRDGEVKTLNLKLKPQRNWKVCILVIESNPAAVLNWTLKQGKLNRRKGKKKDRKSYITYISFVWLLSFYSPIYNGNKQEYFPKFTPPPQCLLNPHFENFWIRGCTEIEITHAPPVVIIPKKTSKISFHLYTFIVFSTTKKKHPRNKPGGISMGCIWSFHAESGSIFSWKRGWDMRYFLQSSIYSFRYHKYGHAKPHLQSDTRLCWIDWRFAKLARLL